MEENIVIRNEKKEDWETVEKITRQAFYNLYVPGCVEHYLVHIMREHEDFIPELDFVLELDGQVIGNIIYTKAKLIDENGTEKEILTFGPVSIHPGYQRMGYGKMLMEHGPLCGISEIRTPPFPETGTAEFFYARVSGSSRAVLAEKTSSSASSTSGWWPGIPAHVKAWVEALVSLWQGMPNMTL